LQVCGDERMRVRTPRRGSSGGELRSEGICEGHKLLQAQWHKGVLRMVVLSPGGSACFADEVMRRPPLRRRSSSLRPVSAVWRLDGGDCWEQLAVLPAALVVLPAAAAHVRRLRMSDVSQSHPHLRVRRPRSGGEQQRASVQRMKPQ
jgi:hypothetical protein